MLISRLTKCFLCLLIFLNVPLNSIWAQSQPIKDLANTVTDMVGSFMDNPYHHSNTLKIDKSIKECKNLLDDLYNKVPLSAREDYYMISNMKRLVKCVDFITANIAGYSRGGIDSGEIESMLNPMLDGFGWSWRVIHSTEDIFFYEYSKDNFRMVLAKNILPKKDIGDFNAVAFSCDSWNPKWKKYGSGVRRVVFGGNYQFVDYGDDEHKYNKISKVASKRGTSFESFK